MPAGGEQLLAGGYVCTWNSAAIGITLDEENVPTIITIPLSQPIKGTDRYAKARIDGLHQGVDYQFKATLMEVPKALPAFFPFATWGMQGQISALKWALSKPLILTAIAGTPAASSPASLTAMKAILADEHRGELTFGPQLRIAALLMDLLVYDTGGGAMGNFTQA